MYNVILVQCLAGFCLSGASFLVRVSTKILSSYKNYGILFLKNVTNAISPKRAFDVGSSRKKIIENRTVFIAFPIKFVKKRFCSGFSDRIRLSGV